MERLFFVILIFLFTILHSQVEVKVDETKSGDYIFNATNSDYCDYSLKIEFKHISNLSRVSNPYVCTITYGSNYLFTLKRESENEYSDYIYSYTCFKGEMNPKINLDYIYLPPISKGKFIKPHEVKLLSEFLNKKSKVKDWYCIGFSLKEGDTIFATRRGIVTDLNDNALLKKDGYMFSRNATFIEVFHNDGTFGKYGVLKDSSIMVNVGDYVEAGDPIAIVEGEKYVNGFHVNFMVYYNYEDETNKNCYAYIPLKIHTEEEGAINVDFKKKYTCSYPDTLIFQEMSKKEIKKWMKKHGKLKDSDKKKSSLFGLF